MQEKIYTWQDIIVCGVFMIPVLIGSIGTGTGALILTLLFVVCASTILIQKRTIFVSSLAGAWLAGFLILSLITVVRSHWPRMSQEHWILYSLGILLCSAIMCLDKKNHTFLIGLIFVITFFNGLYGLIQYVWLFPRLGQLSPELFAQAAGSSTIIHKRIFAFFPSPTLYASFLLLIMPVTLSFIVRQTHMFVRLTGGLLFVLILGNLFLTKSIASLVIGIMSIGSFAFIIAYTKKRGRIFSFGMIFFCIILGISVYYVLHLRTPQSPLWDKIYYLFKDRISYWRTSLAIIAQHPLGGFGPGSYGFLSPLYTLPDAPQSRFAHNIIMQMIIEIGVLGTCIFCLFLTSLFQTFKKYLHETPLDLFRIGLGIGIIAFLIHNLVDYSFFSDHIMYIFWIMTGMVIAPLRALNISKARQYTRYGAATVIIVCGLISSAFIVRNAHVSTQSAHTETGQWKKIIWKNRMTWATHTWGAKTTLSFTVPQEGTYMLYAHVFHNEKRTWPLIQVKARDARGDLFQDYIFFEPTWYLPKETHSGRWMYHAIAGAAPWQLSKGKLTVNLELEGKVSNWINKSRPLSEHVYLEHLLLVPVTKEFVPQIIEMEGFKGTWKHTAYTPRFGTGVMHTHQPASSTRIISLPSPGTYSGFLAVYAPQGGILRVNHQLIKLGPYPTFRLIPLGPWKRDSSTLALTIVNKSHRKNYIAVDYLILLPSYD